MVNLAQTILRSTDLSIMLICCCGIVLMQHNVFVYGKLRVCGRGFSEGKSEAGKRATNFVLAKTSNFLYTVLPTVFFKSDY